MSSTVDFSVDSPLPVVVIEYSPNNSVRMLEKITDSIWKFNRTIDIDDNAPFKYPWIHNDDSQRKKKKDHVSIDDEISNDCLLPTSLFDIAS
jgi:hypothetical protein